MCETGGNGWKILHLGYKIHTVHSNVRDNLRHVSVSKRLLLLENELEATPGYPAVAGCHGMGAIGRDNYRCHDGGGGEALAKVDFHERGFCLRCPRDGHNTGIDLEASTMVDLVS